MPSLYLISLILDVAWNQVLFEPPEGVRGGGEDVWGKDVLPEPGEKDRSPE